MNEVTIEKLEENLDKLIVEVGEEKFVDWEKINES
jgi:hypothetical protein